MDAQQLKDIQSPLKAQYREAPDKALITLRAEGQIGENVSCSAATGRALVEAGLHPAAGGSGLQACSGDMPLEALVACAGVTLNAVAAEGDLDFRGTLGVDKTVPAGFQAIRLSFDLDGELSEEQKAQLLKLTGRYCVVYQTLKASPAITFA